MRVEEQYADVLHNIESAIVVAFSHAPKLLDREVLVAIESLIRAYENEKRNRDRIRTVPSGNAGSVYDQCRRVCEWRLGRRPLNDDDTPSEEDPQVEELSIAELLQCLKRLRKSIRLWHKQGGRQGYLSYVREFIEDANRQAGI